jgi:hypothetical protein
MLTRARFFVNQSTHSHCFINNILIMLLYFFDLCIHLRSGLILTLPAVLLRLLLISPPLVHAVLKHVVFHKKYVPIFMLFITQFSLPFAIFCSVGLHIYAQAFAPRHLVETVLFQICLREMTCSNFGQEVEYPS